MIKLFPILSILFDPSTRLLTITDLFKYTIPSTNPVQYTCTTLSGIFDIQDADGTQVYLNTNFAAPDTTLSDLVFTTTLATTYTTGLYSMKYSVQTTGGTSGYTDSGDVTVYFIIKSETTDTTGGCATIVQLSEILTETACCLSVKAEELYQKKRYCIDCDCRCEELDIMVLAHYLRMLGCYDHVNNECITDIEMLKILNHALKICDGCGC